MWLSAIPCGTLSSWVLGCVLADGCHVLGWRGALTSLATLLPYIFTSVAPEIPPSLLKSWLFLGLFVRTSQPEKAVVVTSILVLLLPLSLILSSYVLIFLSVLRMNSPEVRNKTLATCSSHLCVVGLYFGPGMCIYMRPGSAKTPKLNQGLFLFLGLSLPCPEPSCIQSQKQRSYMFTKKVDGEVSVHR